MTFSGLPPRVGVGGSAGHDPALSPTLDEAYDWVRQYEQDGASIVDIAQGAAVPTRTVRRWLADLNYQPRRDRTLVGNWKCS